MNKKNPPVLILNCTTGIAQLCTRAAAMEKIKGSGPGTLWFVLNLRALLLDFSKAASLIDRRDPNQLGLLELARLCGVRYHHLYFWMREGIIVPSIRPATGTGRGNHAVFSLSDGAFVWAMCAARRGGLRLPLLKGISKAFWKDGTTRPRPRSPRTAKRS